MKKKKTSILIILLASVFGMFQPGEAIEANPFVRVGLVYGANALVAANLQNYSGSGYRVGYINQNQVFIEVGRLSEEKITMVKNRNVYQSGGVYGDTQSGNSELVGAYHGDSGIVYDDEKTAREKVEDLRKQGIMAFVSYQHPNWLVRTGSYSSSNGGAYVTGSEYAITIVETGTADIIFQFDGGENIHLVIMPDISGEIRPVTLFNKNRYAGGFEYRRMGGNNLTVINLVSIQDYVKGVIPTEMPTSWPIEALKAQAVCAKSYAMFNINRHKASGFDICAEVHCQAYLGTERENENSNLAVDQTYGYWLISDGKICNAVYHASNGGATEDSVNVWGTDYSYLKGVPDPFEDLTGVSNGIWSFSCTNETLTKLFENKGIANAGIIDFYVDTYTANGNVYSITFVDANNKEYTYKMENARTFLNNTSLGIKTNSLRYTVTSIESGTSTLNLLGASGQRTVDTEAGSIYVIGAGGAVSVIEQPGRMKVISSGGVVSGLALSSSPAGYVIEGRGAGHNVGMSQWGAKGMAEKGYNFEEILKYYFTGAQLTNAAAA